VQFRPPPQVISCVEPSLCYYIYIAKVEERIKARKLRKKGYSMRSIASLLNISKGTISIWCRDIPLTREQKRRLSENAIKKGHKGRMIGARTNRQRKLENIKRYEFISKNEIGTMSYRDLLFAGTALYWGEGSKTENSRLAFTNSDPEAILFMYKWFKEVFGVTKKEFTPRIFINKIHARRIKKVVAFWSELLKLPKEQFGNPVLLNVGNKKIYDNHDQYYGVLSLRIRKSTNLKYHILGLIKALKKQV
jgi:transcriptional regulator with XRE-family HTH domain